MQESRRKAAIRALDFIEDNIILGVGTGNTVNIFIEELVRVRQRIDSCVASSIATRERLRAAGFMVQDLNAASEVALYIDSADEVNLRGEMIKGGGGALTGEKIVAAAARKFICVINEEKLVTMLGKFPVAVEVILQARSLVARELVKMRGNPVYRDGFVTDNGNIILDVYNLDLTDAARVEENIKLLPGVVENGIFVKQAADIVLSGSNHAVQEIINN